MLFFLIGSFEIHLISYACISGGTSQWQLVRVVRASVCHRSGIRIGSRYARKQYFTHFIASHVSGKFSIHATIHACGWASHRERFCDGWRSYMHGAVNAKRLGQRVHRRSDHYAVFCQSFQRPRTTGANKKIFKRIQPVVTQIQFFLKYKRSILLFCLPIISQSAEETFKSLVKTHEKYGWVTPALSDG